MLSQGDKFLAYNDSVGSSTMFWVNTLSFKMAGNFSKGSVVELEEYVIESNKITLVVNQVEDVLDVPVEDIVIPVSAVGLDKDIEIEEHEDILHYITDVNNENRVFLFLLKIPAHKNKKIRIPLGDTGNLLEYKYEGF